MKICKHLHKIDDWLVHGDASGFKVKCAALECKPPFKYKAPAVLCAVF